MKYTWKFDWTLYQLIMFKLLFYIQRSNVMTSRYGDTKRK